MVLHTGDGSAPGSPSPFPHSASPRTVNTAYSTLVLTPYSYSSGAFLGRPQLPLSLPPKYFDQDI